MNIHEYQSRALFRSYGISTMPEKLIENIDDVSLAYEELGPEVVVKAQVHSGARGKAGGVKFLNNKQDTIDYAKSLLGKKLITIQSGPEGKPINSLLMVKAAKVESELYLSFTVDRSKECISLIVCPSGGIDIEEVSINSKELIRVISIPIERGLTNYDIQEAATFLNLNNDLTKKFSSICLKLYKLFIDKDCSLIEINPLAITTDGNIELIDAKMNFDDNALFRHPDIVDLKDERQGNAREIEASKCGVTYISLDGNIGCLVNGAGLAMATMDAIKNAGGEPANFLDVGGGASSQKVEDAFRIILSDENVKGIIINIFAGITSCVSIAEGVTAAVKKLSINVPIVVRLEGTGLAEGKAIFDKSGIDLIVADSLDDAASKMVSILNKEAN